MRICIKLLIVFFSICKIANVKESPKHADPFSDISTFAASILSSLAGTEVIQDEILENFASGFRDVDPMVFMSIQEIIEYYGYPCETHHVNSSNYRLEMHRIPEGINTTYNQKVNIPVFIQHGLSGSSDGFVVNPPSQSLAFILADLGYDVWLGNIRGNKHSRVNYNLTENESEFWDFEFDDFIEFDVPNMIDYILDYTGEKQIFYLGHSMGTTIGFGLFADKPEYNDKVKAFIALGPAIFYPNPKGYFKVIEFFTLVLEHSPNMKIAGENNPYIFTIPVISKYLEYIFEWKTAFSTGDLIGTLNRSRIAIYGSHDPSGASLKSVAHYGQLIGAQKFQKYDYGECGNMKRYNQVDPPEYDLKKVTVPTYIYVAKNDYMTTPEGAVLAGDAIPNCKGVFKVGSPRNGHLWYMIGPDAHENLYPMIFDAMKSEQNSITVFNVHN